MAQSLNELHSFFAKFMQLCTDGFQARLSFKNEDIGVSVNFSAELGRIELPTFAFNDMMPKKNVTPSQLRRRRRRKAARTKEENIVQEATEYAESRCVSSVEPHSLDADDLLNGSPNSIADDCLSPEILPVISSPPYPNVNVTSADHFQATTTSTTSFQESARLDPSFHYWNQFSMMLGYASSSTDNSHTSSSSSMSSGTTGTIYPDGTLMQQNTYTR